MPSRREGDPGARQRAGDHHHRGCGGRARRARFPAGRAAGAARGAVGGPGDGAVRGGAGRSSRARPGCCGVGALPGLLRGLRALHRKTLDVDLLMVFAAVAAAAVGQVLDGGLLIVIFATSGALEAVATHRTAQAVRGLLDLAPEQATRLGDAGTEQVVDAASLRIGDVILVRPGERIAADGQVLSGSSDVDQATITGEPLPATKSAGDEVFAGTRNGTGALRVEVSRAASDTVVARIVAMVEQASATKAR